MTFSLWKLGLQQKALTVTLIISCLVVDTQCLCSCLFKIISIYVLGRKYINHPIVAYFLCVLGFEIERKFPVRVYI